MHELTQQDLYAIARRQSAIDLGCRPEDFDAAAPVVVASRPQPRARVYLDLPLPCHLVYYGGNAVAAVDSALPGLREQVEAVLQTRKPYCFFETPNMHLLADVLAPHGMKICFLAEYFLPDLAQLKPQPCALETRVLTQPDFAPLYTPEWSNALSHKRPQYDVLGVGAYDNGQLVALAACSADCETMWQIGIDVLPAYRRRGLASALTSRLAREILRCGKVPFYCAAWSNIASVRNAIRSGFRPAWVELTAKPTAFVEEINR